MDKWPYQNTPYLSALPGVGGPGLDLSAGDKPSKLYFVNSFANEKTGGPDPRGPNCFAGTFWWCAYQDQGEGFSKWMLPLRGGYCNVGRGLSMPERSDFDYVGHAAPGAGLFLQTASLRVRGSNSRVWHLPCWVGDKPSADGPDAFQANMRDGLQASSSNIDIGRTAFLNAEVFFSMDEGAEIWYDMHGTSWIRSAICSPLHSPPDFAMPDGSHHEAGVDHGFGHLVGGKSDYSLVMQSLYSDTTDRNPLVAAPNHAHINNLHYNHGRPYKGSGAGLNIDDNGGHNEDAGRSMQANMVGCVAVRGPDNGDSIVFAQVMHVTPGSSGHAANNSVFGWPSPRSQDDFFTKKPAGYMKPTLRRGAWPLGLGFNYDGTVKPCRDPLNPTRQEGLAFAQLIRNTVGCMPSRRYLYKGGINAVMDRIDAAIRGVPFTGSQFVNTVEEAGGWPAVPETDLVDPADPGDEWHAPLPMGADRDDILTSGTFSDGSSCAGYNKLRAWVIEEYFRKQGR